MAFKYASHSRSNVEILKSLCDFDATSTSSSLRLPHDCYMIFVGRVTSRKHFDKLTKQAQAEEDSDDGEANNSKFTMMETEEMEYFLEFVSMVDSEAVEKLANDRSHRFVYEDNFNPVLMDMIKKKASFQQLKKVCRYYETKEDVDVDKIMIGHEKRTALSAPYFIERGLSKDDAQGAAFALSFYTGTKSESASRAASLVARQANGEVIEKKTKDELNEAAIILYYLVKALSYIPYYWGYVTRACQLTDNELKLYAPGCLVTWIQFSSSKKGKGVAKGFNFAHRNTYFKIYSLTGRPIAQFSDYGEDEDEVLFLPHSTFFVFKHEVGYHGTQHTVYMRQVELGLSQWSVLWVDDRIFVENWENKAHMEDAATRAMNLNVHFIPKSSTESALAFLRSPFGQRLKNKKTFRIVTDMNRENEKPVHNAGTRLIKAVRRMGFKNDCMIFTSDQRKAEQILQSELNSNERNDVTVTDATKDLRNFLNFDLEPTSAQQASYANSSKSNVSQKSSYSKNDNGSNKSTTSGAQGYQSAGGGKHHKTHADTNSEMMHSPVNTSIDILIKNCRRRNLTNDRYNCVLLTTGSFNPVHSFHFQNLLRVKQYLEHEHQPPWNVLAGYISPTHDSYVHEKLGDRSWIPATDRCQLCEEAIENEGSEISSWVGVSRGESEWANGFVDFGPVTENFRDFLNSTLVEQQNFLKHPLRIVYVCGLDHFNKCSYLERMAKQKNMACAVVYRVGYEEQQIRRSIETSGAIYIPLSKERSKLPDVSSTQIRQYFENPTASKSNIEQSIYPHVREYMRRKYKKK